jgi:hypothetical protein
LHAPLTDASIGAYPAGVVMLALGPKRLGSGGQLGRHRACTAR